MNRKKKWSHRLLALALAAVMCCSVFPVGAFAENALAAGKLRSPLRNNRPMKPKPTTGRPMPATPTPGNYRGKRSTNHG